MLAQPGEMKKTPGVVSGSALHLGRVSARLSISGKSITTGAPAVECKLVSGNNRAAHKA
jgi:hypothetical protein